MVGSLRSQSSLAALPCLLGLLRAASPTGRALRAPPATATSTIRNGRLAAPDGLQYFLAHWAYYGLFRAPRAAFVRPYQFPLKSCGFSGAETARKRFLLWKMGFSAAKIAPSPPYTPPGTIVPRKGFVPQFTMVALQRLTACNAPLFIGLSLRLFPPLAAAKLRPSRALLGIFDSLRDCERTTKISSQPHTLFVFVVIPRSARSWVHSVPTPSWRGMPDGST